MGFRTLMVACLVGGISSAALGADAISYYGGTCTWHGYNQIASQPADTIYSIVEANYSDARAALADASVVGSQRPAFTWAMETRNACGIALGYLKAGDADAESIQKCDCFHTRMQAYR